MNYYAKMYYSVISLLSVISDKHFNKYFEIYNILAFVHGFIFWGSKIYSSISRKQTVIATKLNPLLIQGVPQNFKKFGCLTYFKINLVQHL